MLLSQAKIAARDDDSTCVRILVYLTTCTGIRWPLQARLLVLTIG
jgi:hypothetical protein